MNFMTLWFFPLTTIGNADLNRSDFSQNTSEESNRLFF
ncbi:hypothetical protein T08_15827 [Trichinella sp. T8]|nr:hypothetical protein T08_15827 [Trichinella sp. T8]